MDNEEKIQIVRTEHAGVFIGHIVERDDANHHVVMKNTRQVFYWDGAAGLPQMAMMGTCKPLECKFTVSVDRVELFGVCEILDVTPEAAKSIREVPVWIAR